MQATIFGVAPESAKILRSGLVTSPEYYRAKNDVLAVSSGAPEVLQRRPKAGMIHPAYVNLTLTSVST
jgi:hypothetical protein